MTRPARSALVLQGGGALGACELGAAHALYKDNNFAPDVIAGVSRLADARDQSHRSH
jgi:predicted acylesterase/phospholipase RssA